MLFQLPGYEKEFEQMWQNSPQDIKEVYGRQYVDGMIKSLSDFSSKSCNSIAAIVDAIEVSVISQYPKHRYLVDGSSSLIDQDNVSTYCFCYMSQLQTSKTWMQ